MLHLLAILGIHAVLNSSTTPNEFFKRGNPTFIVGTAGDESANRVVMSQAVMIRDMLFPTAQIMHDSDIEFAKGSSAWPPNPILFGGPHFNRLLAKLEPSLPFRLELGKLTIGERTFEGNEYRLITVVPSRMQDKDRPDFPEFMLYAGTGSPGVAEINALRHGSEPILIADSFGRLLTGIWRQQIDRSIVPEFGQPSRRIAWRTVDRKLITKAETDWLEVHFRFPQQLPISKDEEQVIQAATRGLLQATQKLGEVSRFEISVYVYPDLGSIASLTGQRGVGHAIVETRVLHVVRSDLAVGGRFEKLMAHEGMHAIAYDTWGMARIGCSPNYCRIENTSRVSADHKSDRLDDFRYLQIGHLYIERFLA